MFEQVRADGVPFVVVGVQQRVARPAGGDGGELPVEVVASWMPTFMPTPPVGKCMCAASPASRTLPWVLEPFLAEGVRIPNGHFADRATEIARRYRRALPAHRDGAAVVAGTCANEPATLDVAEAFVAALLDGGLSDRDAAWTCWSVICFILGLCQEEQSLPARAGLTPGRRPALEQVLPFLAEESFDERFEFGLAKLLPR